MSKIGQIERITQNRVVKLFQDKLKYRYLDNWEKRDNNSNIETEILSKYLSDYGYSQTLISKALFALGKVAGDQTSSLYDVNKAVYFFIKIECAQQNQTGGHCHGYQL